MRLTHIKLSGFKSFTDPTTIHVPGQLVAVIGPNGCGKSNVIDAVRWVLGEASAKQLRGESMQDVIFNGAATRRPAPRASVELVFDNSDHSLQGAWGQYAEVSIKRQLTRQGESTYFINNQTVRRRDITDLFLGTGVGARGLMQVMPFWKNYIGNPSHNLFDIRTNLRYGCTILRHYNNIEKGNIVRALARFNGSLGSNKYPNAVLGAWRNRWQWG